MTSSAIIIQARLNSSRLPNKILLPVENNSNCTLIEFMINRIKKVLKIPIIIAIPDNEKNNKLAVFLDSKDIEYYRGSETDVLGRYLQGGNQYKLSTIVRLTSDCPLIDPYLVNEMLEYFNASDLDYISNTTPPNESTYPDGSDIEIFSISALKKASKEITNKKYREHVTFQFWDKKSNYRTQCFHQTRSYSHLRYTIDNPEDYELFKQIYNKLIINSSKFISYKAIQNFLEENKALQKLNSHYKPGDNW